MNKSKKTVYRKEYPKVYDTFKITDGTEYRYFVVDARGHGWKGQQREQFTNKDEALDRAREIAEVVQKFGVKGVLHDEDARLYRTLVQRVAPFGMALGDVVEDWINFRANNLLNAVSKPVNEIVVEWVNEKSTNKLKPLAEKTVLELKMTEKNLVAAFGNLPIKLVTKEKVELVYAGWEAKGVSLSTIANNYGKMFKSFFEWCIKKNYIKTNPCKDIEVTVPQREIQIYGIDAVKVICERLRIEEKNKKMTPYVILSMLVGLRPNEAAQIGWDAINFETKQVTVKGGLSKVRRTRHIPMPDNVAAWLKPWIGKPIGNMKNFRKRLESVKRDLPEQADILRHTAISFWMGKHKDMGQVAYWMGNSEDTIKEHYLQGLPEADIKTFFELVP